jgi:hypothetical protein
MLRSRDDSDELFIAATSSPDPWRNPQGAGSPRSLPASRPRPRRAPHGGTPVALRTAAETEPPERWPSRQAIRHKRYGRRRRSGTHRVPGCTASRGWRRASHRDNGAAPALMGRQPCRTRPAAPSVRVGSGQRSRSGTEKPRCNAVSEALCRTRTVDPFLTINAPGSAACCVLCPKLRRQVVSAGESGAAATRRRGPALPRCFHGGGVDPRRCQMAGMTARLGRVQNTHSAARQNDRPSQP